MQVTRAKYKRLNIILSTLIIAANGLGALLVILYSTVIDPLPEGASAVTLIGSGDIIVYILGTFVLLVVGTLLSNYVSRFHPKWVEFLLDGGDVKQVTEQTRSSVLNYALLISSICLVMWFLAGIFFSDHSLRGFLVVFGIGGILTSSIVYFSMEIFWRPIVPLFFLSGELHSTRAFRLTVLGRLLITFTLITVYPVVMLAAVSLNRARMIISVPNPQTVLQNLSISIVFIMLISMMVSVGLAVLVTRLITRPLNDLQNAMSRVENNDFNVRVPVYSNDEIGYLTERFNVMVAGLRRGELLRNLLNLYVSPEVAREAIEHGATLGGQLIECTVLFSDIRGFTTISEQLSPDILMDLLNRYMFTMVEVIVSNGGMVNKFGGDSLLAVFGTPLNPSQDHARNAVQTALAMRVALAKFNQSQIESDQLELIIGIGIATGNVIAGNIGGQGRIEYTVIGDTVNLAARLQAMSKELNYSILLNAETYTRACIDVQIEAHELSNVNVRGKIEPVIIYGL